MNFKRWFLLLGIFSIMSFGSIMPNMIFSIGSPANASSKIGDLSKFKKIAVDALDLVKTKNLSGAKARIKDLETSWDEAEPALKPRDASEWHVVDKSIDRALKALRANSPDQNASEKAMDELISVFNQAEGK